VIWLLDVSISNVEDEQAEAQIICSMELFQGENNGGLR
jgi:hypothetical protein